jgi:O-antigen ligase
VTLKSASLVFRYTGIVLLALAVGTSTLTFSWLFGEPSDPRIFREFAAPVIYLSDLFSLVGLALWTVSWVLRGRPTLRLGPSYISVPMAVLAVAGLFSALWAIDSRIALLNGLRLGGLFVMYFVFVNEYRRATPIVAAVLITLGVLHAVVAVAQIVNDAPLGLTTLGEIVDNAALNSYLKLGGRPSGLGFNPNPVGMLMGIGSVLSFAAFLLIRRSVLGRVALIAAFLISTVGLVATKSRWEIVVWVIAMTVVVFFAWRSGPMNRPTLRRNILLPVALLAVILTASVPVLFNQEASGLARNVLTPSGVTVAWQIRLDNWSQSLDIVREYPLIGVGLGSYSQALAMDKPPDNWGRTTVPVDSVPLLALAELGPVGAIAMIVLLASPIVLLTTLSHKRASASQMMWVGPMVILVLAALLEYYPWATQDGRVLLWAVLGLWIGESLSVGASSRDRSA